VEKHIGVGSECLAPARAGGGAAKSVSAAGEKSRTLFQVPGSFSTCTMITVWAGSWVRR